MAHPIVLIDGFSLVFRAYHALQRTGMQSATGEPTFAVFAFSNILLSILEKNAPGSIAVVFDTKEPTFRHELYKEYKAHRDAFPDDLVPQFERIKSLIDMMGIKQVSLAGYEADDIIGTLAKKESEKGNDVLCVTSDKDYFQLVNDKVRILRPGRDAGSYDEYDAAKVKEKFGVEPPLVVDVLALMGDSSDNVPGVKGVGEKTAIPLVEQFRSVEGIYENIESIEKKGIRTKLEDNRDMAFLSKKLVTIITDVPVSVSASDLVPNAMDFQDIDTFCSELGFTTLRKRFAGLAERAGVDIDTDVVPTSTASSSADGSSGGDGSVLKTLPDVDHDYTLVDTQGGLDAMLKDLGKAPELLCVDLETTGLDAMQCAIVGIALCKEAGKAYYIDVDDRSDDADQTMFEDEHHGLPVDEVLTKLRPLLEGSKVGKVGQNLKYDSLVLRRHGVILEPIAFDTMLASYILDADMKHNLDALAERWLQYRPISITTLIGEKRSEQRSMRTVDPSTVSDYACEDVDVAWKLMEVQRPRLEESGLMDLAKNVEFPVEEVLVVMEHNGVCIDTAALANLSDFMRSEAQRLEQEIWKEAGEEFTIGSPKQLGTVLFDTLMLPATKKTKTGYSTDSSVLTELAETYPIAQMVLDWRQVEKLRSTYVEALPRMINKRTGRVHTTFNQTVAATGRLSSTDPNLQNIPVRTELGLQIRKAFVPQQEGWHILSADYSQIELRIMAGISQDENLVKAFADGLDVHASTAAILYDVPIDEVTKDMRRVAKTTNFGIMYGQGAFGLAQRLGIPRSEGQAIIDNYFEKYPGIKTYMDRTIAETRDRGYSTTLLGRRRYFPQITANNRQLQAAAERACINTPIQGTAADMMKLAMINVHKRMRQEGLRSLMMLQVHDELLFEVVDEERDVLRDLVIEEMVGALALEGVPIVVDTGFGASWYEAH
jgi:DNA polymerase I